MPPTQQGMLSGSHATVPWRLVTAAAGFGKTTHALGLCPDARVVQASELTAGSPAPASLSDDIVIVGIDRLEAGDRDRLLAEVAANPHISSVVLTSRTPVEPIASGGTGTEPLVETDGPDELRLGADQVQSLTRAALADPASDLEAADRTDEGTIARVVDAVARLTDGWPGVVTLVLEEGRAPWEPSADPLEVLSRPRGRVSRWLESRLLPSLSPACKRLVLLLGDLEPVPRELVSAVEPGLETAWDELAEIGVLTVTEGGARLAPVIGACLSRRSTPPEDGPAWWSAAAERYLELGHPGPALRAARDARDVVACQRIITDHGDRVIASGWARELLTTVDTLPAPYVDLRARILQGHAARLTGQPALAEQVLESVVADCEAWGQVAPPDLAWRLASVEYGAADFRTARDLCTGARIALVADEPPSDRAMRLATLALCEWQLGDDDAAARVVAEALSTAGRGDDQARATALIAQSMLLTGARRINALSSALATAQRSGDVFLLQRSLTNLSDAQLVAGEYAAALDSADQALALVDRTGPVGTYVSALHNGGEALIGLGDLQAARVRFLRCLDAARAKGLDRTPAALWGLAEVDFQAGRLGDARAAFEEAAELARDTGERQILVPALTRLATIMATAPRSDGDLKDGEALAEEAVRLAPAETRSEALAALGWVLLARGDLAAAAGIAEEAADVARAVQNRRSLGPVLELAAEAAPDPRESGALLLEALAVYQRSDAVLAADRAQLALARLPGQIGPQGASARAAARRLRRVGVVDRPLHPQAAAHTGALEIRVIGGFAVHRDGVPIPGSAWRSRQARTLLKLLVAREGRPIGREEVCEILWPDDDPAKTGHRLSVLLSTLRGALDPDKRHPTEHFVAADAQGIRLVIGTASLDLTDFLADAAEAARLADEGAEEAARQLLADLLTAFHGDAFEEDPYEAWAADSRDHVRATWVQSLRLAARLAGRAGDIDGAVTRLVRLLSADPYDEPAHRMLVAILVRARRHGEARRAFERWQRDMAEVGAEAPDPAVLDPSRSPG